MGKLELEPVVITGQEWLDIGVTALEIAEAGGETRLFGSSGLNGGVTSFQLSEGAAPALVAQRAVPAGSSHAGRNGLQVIEADGQLALTLGGGFSSQMTAWSVGTDGALANPGTISGFTGLGPSVRAMAAIDGGFYFAEAGGGIEGVRLSAGGALPTATGIADTGAFRVEVSVLAAAVVGGESVLLAASPETASLARYGIVPGTGQLVQQGTVGAEIGLGLSNPAALAVATAGGAHFAVLGSAGSHALTVVRLDPGAGLVVTDHVIDTAHTRFANVAAVETVTVSGRSFVIAGGGDDGLSLFELLPGGRLLHLESLADSAAVSLDTIAAIAAARVGGEVQIFAAAQGEAGLTRLSLPTSSLAAPILGSGASETRTGSAADDLISGGGGNDTLIGGAGDDILMDGPGSDTLVGGPGADIFVFAADGSSDRIDDFEPGLDRLDLSGFRMLYTESQVSVVSTSWGARLTFRDEEIEVYRAGGGSLSAAQLLAGVFEGPSRPPLLMARETLGTAGDDTLVGHAGTDLLKGLEGNDRIDARDGDDTLFGGAGDDRLAGEGGNDHIYAGPGADLVFGGPGNDLVFGGPGPDEVYLGDGDDTFEDDAEGGPAGADTVYGGAGQDALIGRGGPDVLFGGTGDDVIGGGAEDDQIAGGDGNDILYGDDGNDRIVGEAGDDVIYGCANYDVLYGGPGNDTIHGGDGRDRAHLGPGDDVFFDNDQTGEHAHDTVFGEGGNDTIYGGGGDDRFFGGPGDDEVFGDVGDDEIHGGSGNDRLYGGPGNDRIYGGANYDTIWGGDGDDEIWGGEGRDTIYLGAGDDRFHDSPQTGEHSHDTVFGGDGRDTFFGGGGDDVLTGGADGDLFVIFAGNGNDRITDFQPGIDLLQFNGSASGLGALEIAGVSGGVRIDYGSGSVLLDGLQPADLGAASFDFV